MLTAPSARGTALNLLSRRLPRLTGDDDITIIVGQDIGLMIRAFAAALEDDNLLVRRSALDILVQSLHLDGAALKKAQSDDRTILMRASISVVLRRDLSLNRRLYSWLLGSSEKTETQVDYLKTNGLDLLCATLKEDMVSPSSEYAESRPFKIFISLLDKWEIGALVTQVLVFDAFVAIQTHIGSRAESAEDVRIFLGPQFVFLSQFQLTMTASTLYEAVEPILLWRPILETAFKEILSTSPDSHRVAITIISFILKTFAQDEEMQTIHLPVIFAALVDLLHVSCCA